jgi:PKD repeat protein
MKKHIPFLLLFFVFISAKTVVSQSWVEKMQDPSVNLYDVQQAFEQYWSDSSKVVYVEVPNPDATINSKWHNASAPPTMLKKKLPGWKVFKRWEDFMRPRLYPSGDRSVMITAMNEYYENFYAADASAPQNRAMSGGGTPTTQAANWTLIGPTTTVPTGGGAGRVNFVRFDPSNTNILWVGSPGGGLWNSTNGGTTWTTNTDNLAVIGISDVAIHPTNNQIMYLATGDGDASDTYSIGVLKSTNGGGTWATTGLNWVVTNGRTISRLLINPVNPNTIFAATSNGVYRSRNAGATWVQIATAVANIKDIEFKPGDTTTVYAASTTRFYKSTNGGTTFTNITSGLPATTAVSRLAIAVTAANPAYVYLLAALATDDGFQGLYRSTDSGTNFTTRATSPNLLGWSSTGSDTGGQGWYDLAIAASPSNAEVVIVGGVNIWRSTNGGTNWTINGHWTGSGAPYVHADIHALEFIPGSSTTYFAGCDGGVFRTTTSGTGWTDLSNGLQIAQAYRIGLSATNSNLLISGWQDNGTNRWSGTATWTRPLGGDGMEAAIDWSNANVQYGELYYGEINRTTTGGNLTTNIVNSGGTGVNANGDWVTPYILNPQRASTLIVGKAQAYRSRNRGTAWTALGTVTGGTGNLCALAYAPSDSSYIYMAKINRFYASTNNGTTFTDRTGTLPVTSAAITYIAVASNNPAHVWVTFSGYSAANKVWYSADAGVTWTNYSTGIPNLPVNCIVYQNGSATDVLYVGTDVGVYSRDNTASSWTAYNTGLPNVSVRELEIQYGVSKLRAATFGRGMWQSDLASPGTSPPVADFSANRTNICIGDCINFTDLSSGAPTSWSWSFPGSSTATSTIQNPTGICYPTAGTYNVTLTATNANGSNPITKTAYITVSGTVALPLTEGFEGAFLPAGWYLNNPDSDGYAWIQSSAAGGFGTSTMSAAFDNYSPPTTTVGNIDEFSTPKYNFTGVSSATMTFDVAYARYNGTYTDSLTVFISTNCGATWTSVYAKGGYTGLQTAPDNNTSAFDPTSAQWRTETVNMTPFAGQANVMVKFQNRSGWGQWLYIDNINITGVGSPVASVSIAQTTGTNPMCAGATAIFTATSTNGGTAPAYQWQVNGSNVGTNSPTYTTTALTNGQIVTCIMTSNLAGVTGSPATSNTITMTVTALPATPAPTSNSPVCTGATINLFTATVAGATYSWAGPATFTSALQNPTRATATMAMAGTYSVTVTSGGCTSLPGTVAVIVNTTPAAPTAGSNTPVCAGAAINLTATTVAGATYSWTGPAAFTSTTQNPNRPTATTAMAGTYSVTAIANGCTSAIATTAVVVNAVPATPTATVSSPVCTGNTITLSTPTVTGATYAWTGPATFTSALQNSTRPTATAAMSGTYSVTVTVSGCTSAAGTATLVVNPTPAAPTAGSNSPVCSGSTINLTATTVTGATYNWSGPSYTSTIQNPTRPTSTVAMSGTYSVTATVGGCTSTAGTTAVIVNATPATPASGSNSPVCSGNVINLTTTSVSGATYSWTGPSSFVSTAQNPSISGATTAMAGTYSVTVTAGSCTSAIGTVALVVNATPAMPLPNINGSASPSAICAGGTITLTSNNIGGATYSWSGPNSYTAAVRNPPALTNATAVMAGTYSLTVTVGGCTSNTAMVSIGVTPMPATPTASSNSSVCTGSTISLTTPAVSGATYSWTGPSGYTSSVQNPNRPSATVTMAGTYSVTVTVSGCTSLAGTTVVAVNSSVTPGVSVTQTAGTNPMCAGTTATFTATPSNGGTTPSYQWQVDGSNVGMNSATYSSTALTNGQAVTCIMTSGSGCASPASATSNAITMTVNPAVTPSVSISIVSGSNPMCSGQVVSFLASAVNGGSGPVYQWQVNGANAGTNMPTYTSAVIANGDMVTCTITSNAACAAPVTVTSAGITMVVSANVTPAISISVSPSSTICEGDMVTFTAAESNGGSSPFYQWQVNGANAGMNSATYVTSILNNGDNVTCVLTSSSACATTPTANSNSIVMAVNPVPATPTITQAGSVLTSSSATDNQWYLNGSPIAGETAQDHTFLTNGNYTVVVTTAGCSATSAITSITNVGIDPELSSDVLLVYPNPNDGNFTLSFLATESSDYKIEITNAIGQQVYVENMTDFSGSYSKQLSVIEFGQGVYTISLTNSKKETVKKIIVY